MIVVKLMGGLGNQLFQIAYAIHLSSLTKKSIYIDKTVYLKYKIRSYSLDELEVSNCFKGNIQQGYIKSNLLRFTQVVYKVYHKIMRLLLVDRYGRLPFRFLSKFGLFYNFDRFYYDVNIKKAKKIYIYGYFQSEKYFIDNVDLIKSLFKVKKTITNKEMDVLNLINQSSSVAVSMRLGDDYKKTKHLNVCDNQYYHKAISLAKTMIPGARFFIFSDDIEKAKEILGCNNDCFYIEGFTEIESFRLMYNCHDFIISNSSFSWWGAYLSENKNKIIITPSVWFKFMKNEPDIFFEKMIRI
ncbi:alpha-1,2-fucosyltransferase [Vibrio sp. S11_S32]|uniref:alpha-1,2-fucosyltransferase n=1 Tax=Vibrio sp. S11_S32 TaxID=2720225 RepID=UPI0016812E5B|nr:alpha-1,2-fucosyltransferase [Vibrio sp. S11_S32]MBD1577918.1 alpha-1,2-fucosyltransferase [Vibrio sp. S11_S32]